MRDTIAAIRSFEGFDDMFRRKVMAGNAQAIFLRFARLQ
jgi:hypothetical protein